MEKNVTKGVTGTPNYIAPEIILGDKLTCKIDNFAIGSILYFLYIYIHLDYAESLLLHTVMLKKLSSTQSKAITHFLEDVGTPSAVKPKT